MVGWLLIAVGIFEIVLGAAFITHERKFPPASKLQPDAKGIIHHPTLGDYPQEVEYTPGMTLYPGQSASISIEIRRATHHGNNGTQKN